MLTDKQERFAQCIALEGMNQSDAYRESYDADDCTDKTIWEKASIEANKDKVKARIDELRNMAASEKILSVIERKIWLSDRVRDKEEKRDVQCKCIDMLNKMDGEYVQKIEADVKVTKLEDLL